MRNGGHVRGHVNEDTCWAFTLLTSLQDGVSGKNVLS